MRQTKINGLLKYELVNTVSNFYTPFFGLVFPIIMGYLLIAATKNSIPAAYQAKVVTGMLLTIALIIPFSTMLVGFAATFSQESEKGVVLRFDLFNFKERDLILTKIIIHYALITCSGIIYASVMFLTNDILMPKLSSFLIYLLCYYTLATLLFIFAYAITTLLKKFATSYAVTMSTYMLLLGLSGMMGPRPDQLPKLGQKIAYSFPMAYIVRDFSDYWTTGFSGYNFAPLIQSFIFMAAIVALVYLVSWYQRRRDIS